MSEPQASPPISGGSAVGNGARSDPRVRGFLFADLRGYTAFVERAGDRAAAGLLARYRMLVRSVVASHDGAEIRTEGDSFYVVFPTPSAAVRAGLAIVGTASEDAAEHPTDPISVGVGIHAGESEATDEGYVGSVVNLAARICAVAGPGEVLVSDTVRALTRTSLDATFAARGRKSLKGVAEPVALWAVRPTGGMLAPVARPRVVASRGARAGLIALGAGVVIIAVVGIAALSGYPTGATGPSGSSGASGGSGVSASGAARPSASGAEPSAGPEAFHTGPLEAGTYHTAKFTPGLAITVPDGWTGIFDIPNAVMLGLVDDPMRRSWDEVPAAEIGGRLTIMRPTIAASSCTPRLGRTLGRPPPSAGPLVDIPAGRDGFLAWARSDPTFALGPPSPVRLGAFDTTRYEVTPSDSCDLSAAAFQAAEVFALSEGTTGIYEPAQARWTLLGGSRTSWYLWDLGGQTMLVAIDAPTTMPDFEAAARSVLTSLAPAD